MFSRKQGYHVLNTFARKTKVSSYECWPECKIVKFATSRITEFKMNENQCISQLCVLHSALSKTVSLKFFEQISVFYDLRPLY